MLWCKSQKSMAIRFMAKWLMRFCKKDLPTAKLTEDLKKVSKSHDKQRYSKDS
jgi:hypothetical protein